MKFKQLYFSNSLIPVRNDKNESLNSFDNSDELDIADNNASENHVILKLQELEERNAYLESLVNLRTKELSDVVATNAKFISIIAHDLRNPFSSIIGILQMLKEDLNDINVTEIEKYINIASNSANSTLILLDNLLAWTISQNTEKFNPIKINLRELLTFELNSFTSSATRKQVSMHQSISPYLNVSADLQMVKSILKNLISNAIKYSNIGGEITISASENKQFVEIIIKDNGIGISYDIRRNLFKIDAFHSTIGTDNEQGTGIGLMLCKGFIEIHGGNMQIESEPGEGSEFKFTLPHYL